MLRTTAIRVGDLRHRIQFAETESSVTSFGTTIDETPTTDDTVWAAISPSSGREFFDQEQVQAENTVVVLIRYRSGTSPKQQFTHDGKTYEIISVKNMDERDFYMYLLCKEIV